MSAPKDAPALSTVSASTDAPTTPDEALLLTESDLYFPFEAAFRSPGQLIGLEAEKFAVRDDGSPLKYGDSDGVPALFAELVEKHGWRPDAEKPGGPVLALLRGSASITLEPGSQFELSGAPYATVHEVMAEVEQHRRELASLESAAQYHWLGLGFHPFARQEDLDWVPKSRYPIMRSYLPTRGKNGLDMMRRTSTVQANFDVTSGEDAMRKLRVSLALSPLVTALFANSAVVENKRNSAPSKRAQVWLDVDNERAGLLPFAWREGASLGDYVRWALSVPMFILKRHGHVLDATSHTFGRFMAEGLHEHRARRGDWETHLNTLFPDVRLKRTLEVRSADGVPAVWSAALPAFWAGILYDEGALQQAGELVLPFGYEAWNATREQVASVGMAATVAGKPLRDVATAVLAIAHEALARRAHNDAQGRDERQYLEPLMELAAQGQCIGDAVLGDWSPDAPDARAKMFERAKY